MGQGPEGMKSFTKPPLIYVARALQDREGERGTAIINIIIRLNFQLKLQISTRIQVLKGKNVTPT